MTLEEMKLRKKEKGYSVEQISKYSGVPIGTLQKIFAGVTENPRYETREAIERVLGDEGNAWNGGLGRQVSEAIVFAADTVKKQGEYTVEDYYNLPDERRVELIDGHIYDMSSPTFVHQGISQEVSFQLMSQIRRRGGECKTICSPIDVRLDCDDKTMLQPDVLIICNRSKIKKWGITGAPDWVLEITSPTSKSRDYFMKMMKYKEAGVKEYWIIDPKRERLTVYDFTEEMGPNVYPLSGKLGLTMYNGEIEIDLDEVSKEITDYPED